MNLQVFKKELLKDEKFKKEYERFDVLFEIEMLFLRIKMVLRYVLSKIKENVDN